MKYLLTTLSVFLTVLAFIFTFVFIHSIYHHNFYSGGYWLITGIFSTLASILTFRTNGSTSKKGELYLVVLGVLLGPITLCLLILDSARSKPF